MVALSQTLAGAVIPGLYNFKPSNTRYTRRGLANVRSATSNMSIVGIGDSTTAGFTTTIANMRATSYLVRLLEELEGLSFAAGYGNSIGDAGASASSSTLAIADTRVTLGAGWDGSGPFGIGGASLSNSTTTNALAFTPVDSFDTIEVIYIRNSGLATFTVDVDGGAALATINSAGAAGVIKQTISCAAGTHTVNIKRNGTGTFAFIVAINTYLSTDKQILLLNAGASSSRAQNWATVGTAYDPDDQLGVLAADLAVISLGINDAVAGRSAAQLSADLQVVITKQLTVGDCWLMPPVPSNTGVISATVQSEYRDVYFALARSNDIPLIDLPTYLGAYASALSGVWADSKHLTASGYADVARIIRRAIM